jgi:hypothetical protein
LHAATSHTYGLHGVATPGEQLPAPSQNAADVATFAAHDGVEHGVDFAGGAPHAMRLDPSQSAWHGPLPRHAPRAPCGCAPITALQVPIAPPTSHASHFPVHDVLQQ